MEETYWNPVAVLEDIYHQMYKKRYQEIPRALITVHSQLLQEGWFSFYEGEWSSPHGVVEVMAKVMSKGCSEEARLDLLQKAAVMGQFTHPKVLQLFGVVSVEEPVSHVPHARATYVRQYNMYQSLLSVSILLAIWLTGAVYSVCALIFVGLFFFANIVK